MSFLQLYSTAIASTFTCDPVGEKPTGGNVLHVRDSESGNAPLLLFDFLASEWGRTGRVSTTKTLHFTNQTTALEGRTTWAFTLRHHFLSRYSVIWTISGFENSMSVYLSGYHLAQLRRKGFTFAPLPSSPLLRSDISPIIIQCPQLLIQSPLPLTLRQFLMLP